MGFVRGTSGRAMDSAEEKGDGNHHLTQLVNVRSEAVHWLLAIPTTEECRIIDIRAFDSYVSRGPLRTGAGHRTRASAKEPLVRHPSSCPLLGTEELLISICSTYKSVLVFLGIIWHSSLKLPGTSKVLPLLRPLAEHLR